MGQTVYVDVSGSAVSTFAAVPSGSDTTSGYYITYVVAEDGGFSGMNWYWDIPGNPLKTAGLNDYTSVLNRYNANGGNLNDVFGSWLSNAGADLVHSFCNHLWNNARGCIDMV